MKYIITWNIAEGKHSPISANGSELCTRHHHLVHEGGFGLQKLNCSRAQITNPQGVLIPEVAGGRSRGNVDELFGQNQERGIRITPKTSQSRWMGEKMDDQLAVEGLLFGE